MRPADRFQPALFELAQLRPIPDRSGRHLAKFGQVAVEFLRHRPKLRRLRPNFGRVRPMLGRTSPTSPDFGRTRSRVGRTLGGSHRRRVLATSLTRLDVRIAKNWRASHRSPKQLSGCAAAIGRIRPNSVRHRSNSGQLGAELGFGQSRTNFGQVWQGFDQALRFDQVREVSTDVARIQVKSSWSLRPAGLGCGTMTDQSCAFPCRVATQAGTPNRRTWESHPQIAKTSVSGCAAEMGRALAQT